MSIIRAQCILRHSSGLPKHDVVNTFHFNGDAAAFAVGQAIFTGLRDFYLVQTAIGASVAALLSPEVTKLDIKLYDIPGTLQANGRETPAGPPFATQLGSAGEMTVEGKQGMQVLPSEVAICLSMQGTAEVGLVQARRRGRVFIGPLNSGASTGVAIARPSVTARTVLEQAATRLAQDVDAQAEWVVYSRPYAGRDAIPREDKPDLPALPARAGTTVNIDEFWVDDAFDTQRKRGADRTGRTLVPAGA